MPGGIESIAIGAFENRTGESGIEAIITNDIIFEFTRTGKSMITEKDRAGALLTGVIRSARSRNVSRSSTHATAERRITVVMDVKLELPSGDVIWSADGVSAYEEYTVSGDKLRTEQNKRSAIAILSEKMAERIYYQMTDRF